MNKTMKPKAILIIIIVLFALIVSLSVASYLSSVKNIPPIAVRPTEEPTITPTPIVSVEPTVRPTSNLTSVLLLDRQKFSGIRISDDKKSILDAVTQKVIFTIDDTKQYLTVSGYAYNPSSFYNSNMKYDGDCFGDAALSNKKDQIVFSTSCIPGVLPNPESWVGIYTLQFLGDDIEAPLAASEKMKFLFNLDGSNFVWSKDDKSIAFKAEGNSRVTISYQPFKITKTINLQTNTITERENKVDSDIIDWQTHTDKNYGYLFKYPNYFTNEIINVAVVNTNDAALPQKCPAVNDPNNGDPSAKLKGVKTTVNNIVYCEYKTSDGHAGSATEYIMDTTIKNKKFYTISYNIDYPACSNFCEAEDCEKDPKVIDCEKTVDAAFKTMVKVLSTFSFSN